MYSIWPCLPFSTANQSLKWSLFVHPNVYLPLLKSASSLRLPLSALLLECHQNVIMIMMTHPQSWHGWPLSMVETTQGTLFKDGELCLGKFWYLSNGSFQSSQLIDSVMLKLPHPCANLSQFTLLNTVFLHKLCYSLHLSLNSSVSLSPFPLSRSLPLSLSLSQISEFGGDSEGVGTQEPCRGGGAARLFLGTLPWPWAKDCP